MSDAPSPHPPPGPPATVLVIDDNMDTADSLARFLRVGAGFDVKVAYDGQTGVKIATAELPEVIVCDIAMPKLSGLRVADAVSQLHPRPLLIAVTAFAGEFPEAKAREAGFDFYLAKPADPFVIESLVLNRDRRPRNGAPPAG